MMGSDGDTNITSSGTRTLSSSVAIGGKVVEKVPVDIGPALLDRFSQHLYSSPNKAFEELISNAWDADATLVHVGFPANLQKLVSPPSETITDRSEGEDAHNSARIVEADQTELALDPEAEASNPDAAGTEDAVWVLDNGNSMNAQELKKLWIVSYSEKRTGNHKSKRTPIGKFGVGKLATYLLANNVVYFCKASDGVIRSVEIDYAKLGTGGGTSFMLSEPVELEMQEHDEQALENILQQFSDGTRIMELIRAYEAPSTEGTASVHSATEDSVANEFGGIVESVPPSSKTWTLVLLSQLKVLGGEMQPWRIKRMLEASLPLASAMTITMNDEVLASTKVDIEVAQCWPIGPELGIGAITVGDQELATSGSSVPYPRITIEGIPGEITGEVKLYSEKISGGKSDEMGYSNGFFVNVRGRIINASNNYFGLKNLSHSAWSKFRCTVQADWLDDYLAVSREGVADCPEVRAFRSLLMALFNMARSLHDANERAGWPNAGDILVKRYGSIPFRHLHRTVSEGLRSVATPPLYILIDEKAERSKVSGAWSDAVSRDETSIVQEVKLEGRDSDGPLVQYDVARRTVLVNQNHPFSLEHGKTKEEKELLRDVAFADLMGYAFMQDIGVSDDSISQIFQHRDATLRLLAKVHRRTALQLAQLLSDSTAHDKGLEQILAESLQHLGFVVEHLAGAGEPEGVAYAPMTPKSAAEDKVELRSYHFTYDAKSSKHKKAKSGNVKVGSLARHKRDKGAAYALVVAPDFQDGFLSEECKTYKVTPMRAEDLGLLLMNVAAAGQLDFVKFEEIFQLYDPQAVHDWVQSFVKQLQSSKVFGLDNFLNTIAELEWQGPDPLNVSVIAKEGRRTSGMKETPTRTDVKKLVEGLQQVVPALIRLNGDEVILNASPQTLRDAIMHQIKENPKTFVPKERPE